MGLDAVGADGQEPFDALLIAAARDQVNEHARGFEAAGLKVAAVGMETLAPQHLIEHSQEAMGLPQELRALWSTLGKSV